MSTAQFLYDFRLQITLQPLKFTTAGYYTINLELLTGIFIGVVSYAGMY